MTIHEAPAAIATVCGGREHPKLKGTVKFLPQCDGTVVVADICGLPKSETGFFAFHIHEGKSCCQKGFSDTKGHFNPTGAPHPNHAGDLPPLLSCDGRAELAVFTTRFCVKDVIGKTVVIHSEPDDFHTQPAGNAGEKIACGVIYGV